MTTSFKHVKDNKYTMLVDGVYFGVSFLVPEGYTIDDYEDSIEVWDSKEIKRCQNLLIELANKPSEIKIYLESNAGVTCTDGLILKISKTLTIEQNESIVLSAKEGASVVSFGTLSIKNNKDTNIEFYPTPKGANSKESPVAKDLASRKDSSSISHNDRINYKLQDNFVSAELISGKTYSKKPVTIDFTSNYFSRVMHASFNTKDDNAEIKFESDEAFLLYNTASLLGEAKDGPVILRSTSKTKNGNRITLDECFVEFQSSAFISTKARALNINKDNEDPSGTSYFNGINHINSADVVNVSNGTYRNIDIVCSNDILSLSGKNEIKGTHIGIVTYNESKESTIKDSKFRACHINDLNGDIVESEIFNCLGKNMEIGEGAKITCDFTQPEKNEQFIIFNNLTLKEGTELAISNALEVDNKRVFNNCIVEKGKFKIIDTNPYTISNTVFRDGQLALNFKGEATIQNSIFEGKNDLRDIIGIYSCDLKNVSIRAKESTSISNEVLKDEQIKDYGSFSKERYANEKQEIKSRDFSSEDIEVL